MHGINPVYKAVIVVAGLESLPSADDGLGSRSVCDIARIGLLAPSRMTVRVGPCGLSIGGIRRMWPDDGLLGLRDKGGRIGVTVVHALRIPRGLAVVEATYGVWLLVTARRGNEDLSRAGVDHYRILWDNSVREVCELSTVGPIQARI